MAERTSPEDALELICWHLNYRQGETLSLNEVAEATGLSWATVHKYVHALETLQNLAPRITTDADGVHVGARTGPMNELFSEGASALAVYLLIHARPEEDATRPLAWADHAPTLAKYAGQLDKMESLGWIERDEDTIRLTPTGVRIAGPAYSEVKNATPMEGDLRRYRHRGEIRAVLAEEASGLGDLAGQDLRVRSINSLLRTSYREFTAGLQEEWTDLPDTEDEATEGETTGQAGALSRDQKTTKSAAAT